MRGSAPCPCSSGRPYAACCRPLHAGEAAPTVEALVRARYAAFAQGGVDYLVATTHPDNPDWLAPRDQVIASLRRLMSSCKFTGLTVLDAAQGGERGQALFRARLFKKGKDVSFTELSDFARDDGRWKYVDGRFVDGEWRGLTLAAAASDPGRLR